MPTTTWTDNCDGTNGDDFHGRSFDTGPGTWTATDGAGNVQVDNNNIQRDTAVSGYRSCYPGDAVVSQDCESTCTKPTGSIASGPALLAIGTDGNTGYGQYNRRVYEFASNNTTAGTIVAATGAAPANGSVIQMLRNGNDIEVYDDTVLYITASSETTYMDLVPGWRGTTNECNDVVLAGDVASAGGGITNARLAGIPARLAGVGGLAG